MKKLVFILFMGMFVFFYVDVGCKFCFGLKGGILYCMVGGKFVCNDGFISVLKKICINWSVKGVLWENEFVS